VNHCRAIRFFSPAPVLIFLQPLKVFSTLFANVLQASSHLVVGGYGWSKTDCAAQCGEVAFAV